jgi:probable HAF family extracellular repeat protein
VGLGFGSHASAQQPQRAYLIDLNSGTATDLGTLYGYPSVAYGINDAGQVVGESGGHAFITGLDGMGMRELGNGSRYAYGINSAGQVVGEAGGHAFITGPNGMGMRDLGTLGESRSAAYGINNAGQVVGHATARMEALTTPSSPARMGWG